LRRLETKRGKKKIRHKVEGKSTSMEKGKRKGKCTKTFTRGRPCGATNKKKKKKL